MHPIDDNGIPCAIAKFSNQTKLCRAIGYVPGSAAHIDNAQLRRVSIDYPYSAATAFGSLAAAEGNRFQFVYLSGALVEDDPKKTLWIHGTFRHTRVGTQGQEPLKAPCGLIRLVSSRVKATRNSWPR